MGIPLKLLLVEDSEMDAELIVNELRRAGFEPDFELIDEPAAMEAALEKGAWEIVISDFRMPRFSGPDALRLLKSKGRDIPFIIISGTIGEETAVQLLKDGACDFLLKDRLARLGLAVAQALENQRLRAERILKETELKRTSDLLRAVAEGIPEAVFVKDLEGRYLLINQAASKFVGRPASEVIGEDDASLFDADGAKQVMDHDRKVRDSEMPETCEEFLIVGGVARTFLATRAPYRDSMGNIIGTLGVSHDITERKRSERRLNDALDYVNTVLRASPVGILTYAATGRCVSANESAARLIGGSVEQLKAQSFRELASWGRSGLLHAADEAIKTGQEQIVEAHFVTSFGKEVWISARFYRFYFEGRPHLLGIFSDVAERKQLEERYRQAQKMNAVGQLAGGVAHDFNNLLTVICGHASLLSLTTGMPSTAADSIREISLAVDRAAGLTRQLLAFSRQQPIQLKALDLIGTVDNLAKMLRRLIGEHISLRIRNPTPLPPVLGDSGLIEQLLVNLVVNARDAMPHGGRLTITSRALWLESSRPARSMDSRPGQFVCLSVQDTGTGIPPEVVPKIFEAFFTTKPMGQGTGLGLATVHSIAQRHEGWVEFSTEVGKGTSFEVFLPARPDLQVAVAAEREVIAMLKSGNETILIVEDDPSLLELTRTVLERKGYRVLEATSGVVAIDVWNKHAGQIDLVVTDMLMPDGKTGRELIHELRRFKPELKALFVSGYSSDIFDPEFCSQEGRNFLQKPFSLNSFLDMVRERLDEGQSGIRDL